MLLSWYFCATVLNSDHIAQARVQDFSVPLSLNLISEPIQIIVGIALLIWTLGYSALVGLGVLIFAMPFQGKRCVQCTTKNWLTIS